MDFQAAVADLLSRVPPALASRARGADERGHSFGDFGVHEGHNRGHQVHPRPAAAARLGQDVLALQVPLGEGESPTWPPSFDCVERTPENSSVFGTAEAAHLCVIHHPPGLHPGREAPGLVARKNHASIRHRGRTKETNERR